MIGWTRVAALAAALAAAACGKSELVCTAGLSVCGAACVDLARDGSHCGQCGVACPAGEICGAGACSVCAASCPSARGCAAGTCLPDLLVACFATDEVRPLALDLSASGPPRAVDDGPISLAVTGGRAWVSHALTTPTVVGFGPAATDASSRVTLGGGDLEVIRAALGLLFVSDAVSGNLVVVDPGSGAPRVADDVPLARSAGVFENPKGIAVVGQRAFVALYGSAGAGGSFASGQQLAVVTLPSTSCGTPPCASVTSRLSLDLAGQAYDPPGLPFPSYAVAAGSRVLVTLANLKAATGPFGTFFTDPAGPGRLAVVDTAAADALTFVSLGAGCTNPGSIALQGGAAWVACGGTSALVRVDLAASPPLAGAPVALPAGVVPGSLAFCGGWGYVTDQFSGRVVRFDPAGTAASVTVEVCPVEIFALAADVACAP
jgi:hypothetical protein